MRFSIVRRGVVALAALLLLALMFVALLPWVASTQIVRDRIAHELSLWSGYRVTLGEAPVLDVWPTFKATLNDVAFNEWARNDNPPVLEADRLEVSLSALAALRGNVVISAVTMYRPLLRLTIEGAVVDLPASPGGGRMMRAVDSARAIVASNPNNPDQSALPGDNFGTVEFVDGRIVVLGGDAGDGITSLNGRIAWPSLDRAARVTATGIWRGENITVEARLRPLLLLAGANTQVFASLKSSLLETSFDGIANLAGDAYFEGQASLASPSLRRMLEWSKTDIAPGAAIGAVSIASRVQGTAKRLRLDSVALTLGGNPSRGVLEVSFADPVPAISGTLAFERLDLRSFLAAFTPLASSSGNIYDQIDTGFSEQLSLDLRLSATTATLGSVALTNLAASTQVKGNLAAFDISDAEAFGGSVQAGVKVDMGTESKTVEMRLMANEVDAQALAKAAGAERLLPQGRANISVMLKGAGRDWNTVMGNTEGTVSATLGQGSLQGIDLAKFTERVSAGGFFPLTDVNGGAVALRAADLKANVRGGVARIEKGDLLLDGKVISMVGIVPYFGRALALSGYLAPRGEDGTHGDPDMSFFIGGAWDAPFFTQATRGQDHE